MKKLLFSAIALVAFSTVSMGNTIELNESKIEDLKNYVSLDNQSQIEVACATHAANVMANSAEAQNFNDTQYMRMFRIITNMCINSVTYASYQ